MTMTVFSWKLQLQCNTLFTGNGLYFVGYLLMIFVAIVERNHHNNSGSRRVLLYAYIPKYMIANQYLFSLSVYWPNWPMECAN